MLHYHFFVGMCTLHFKLSFLSNDLSPKRDSGARREEVGFNVQT